MLASKWTFGAAVVAALTMMACSSSGSPEASKGKDLFTKYQCSVCHNTTGAAGGTVTSSRGGGLVEVLGRERRLRRQRPIV